MLRIDSERHYDCLCVAYRKKDRRRERNPKAPRRQPSPFESFKPRSQFFGRFGGRYVG
jgi:hypothetical protein